MVIAEVVEGEGEGREVQDLVPAIQQVQLTERSDTPPQQQSTVGGTTAADSSPAPVPPPNVTVEPPQLTNEEALAAFPVAKLSRLEESISLIRWMIPVLPDGELEILLQVCIDLANRGVDTQLEHVQRFYRESLTISFTRIMTDDAVNNWALDTHKGIKKNTELLIQLICVKLNDDWYPLLDLLHLIFNPNNKFHSHNASRPSKTSNRGQTQVHQPQVHQSQVQLHQPQLHQPPQQVHQQQVQVHQSSGQPGQQSEVAAAGQQLTTAADSEAAAAAARLEEQQAEQLIFAQSHHPSLPRGWLVDLLNLFGACNGFQKLRDRILSGRNLSIHLIYCLVKPFGLCHEFLTLRTIEEYFLPLIDTIPAFLQNLTDEELKKETKNENKYDTISGVVKGLKKLCSMLPGKEESVRSLEMFRLKMLLRQLQISNFSGKMSALNEVNKALCGSRMTSSRYPSFSSDYEDWLSPERMVEWAKENNLIKYMLRDCLHQPQYVDKMEKIIRFIIKEKALTLDDLDDIWLAQVGKHEAIVKNVQDLLAKLAWDFSPDQLDHLFECFQSSWTTASTKQREKLLELIRRLAEDDKDGDMAEKVLKLFWNLAHMQDNTEIMDQALKAHVKILDYSCTQNRDQQKNRWLDQCVAELKANDKWVIPALRQIKDICSLYHERPPSGTQRTPGNQALYRHDVINRLQRNHALVILIANNLTDYMDKMRRMENLNEVDPANFLPDGRYNHNLQVSERLNFLRFLLRDGQLWLCKQQAKQIWTCLAENAVFPSDREQCFKWFSKLMGEEPDLDPDINKEFFESNILELEPSLLTEAGIKCFERFFKTVNIKEGKLIAKRRSCMMDDTELIGLEYLWKVIAKGTDEVAKKAIELMKDTFTNLGPKLAAQQTIIHEDFNSHCLNILKSAHDTLSVMKDQKDKGKVQDLTQKLCRTLKVLHEYISECDDFYPGERSILPLYRAARGKQVFVTIRYQNPLRQIDDMELSMHDNETLATLRRNVFVKLKTSPCSYRLELANGQEALDTSLDRMTLTALGVRDKAVLNAKLSQVGSSGAGGGASSPDSSSDSSTGSPQHNLYEGPNPEAEACLPGVILSAEGNHSRFFSALCDLGVSLGDSTLEESALAMLKQLPADAQVIRLITQKCIEGQSVRNRNVVEDYLGTLSPTYLLYHLVVLHSLLMPGGCQPDILSEAAFKFQNSFILAGGVRTCLNLLVSPTISSLNSGLTLPTYLVLLKINKFLLLIVANSLLYMVVDAQSSNSNIKVSTATHNHAVQLQHAIQAAIPCPGEVHVRQAALRLGQHLLQKGAGELPNIQHVRFVYRLAWSAAAGDLGLHASTPEQLRAAILQNKTVAGNVASVAREAVEVLTLTIALHPQALDTLAKDKVWHAFVVDLVVLSGERMIRLAAADQMLLCVTRATGETQHVKFLNTLLFTVIGSLVPQHENQSAEYFLLICRLLAYLSAHRIPLTNIQALLSQQIELLGKVRREVAEKGETSMSNTLLEGHLNITRELVLFLTPERKEEVGCGKINLIREIVEDWIFPASKLWLILKQTGDIPQNHVAVCQTPATTAAAFDLLVALCTGCQANLVQLSGMLFDMFYSEGTSLSEWDYLPPVGPRPKDGFVGLKNAGATCYMNSVLQQLFMLENLQRAILAADGACKDPNEDFSVDERLEEDVQEDTGDRNEYNVTILKQIQAIFGHLAETQLQYYIPKGLWKHFKMSGEPVNLREQQDAVEFLMTLIDNLDEALKHLGHPQICTSVLGGILSDQKICKTCPHRYSTQAPSSVIPVDVQHHSNLADSLAEYTKGELLETENAYYCEQCNKKVDTVKRLCIKKLPPILVIQLNRFQYDHERDTTVKFNDYFEFPRELDMEPYTVAGLAKRENEAVDFEPEDLDPQVVRKYNLRGMVVHSGQASGGHYYSYIRQGEKWYKFDDGDVTEVNMEEDEELKNQCWGGEYLSEVFDHVVKKMSFRRQKRWWNAYMLFYCRQDLDNLSSQNSQESRRLKMPLPIEKSIVKQNVRFLHNRNGFSVEYFNFMKKLISCNSVYVTTPPEESPTKEQEEMSLATVKLASAFLFTIGFHTKKSVRGNAMEWYDILSVHLRSRTARAWFCNHVLFAQPTRFAEYLLECPAPEVRQAFAKLLVFCSHFSQTDPPSPPPRCLQNVPIEAPASSNLSDHLLLGVLALLWAEVADYGRNLVQYFGLFAMYISLGVKERAQLLNLSVPAIFIQVALDDGPGPSIKYQYAELGKLYQVVSNLVRCCDVSCITQSCEEGGQVLPNPYLDQTVEQQGGYIMPIPHIVKEQLFQRSAYVKKVIEDANNTEDTKKLLQFCSWENPVFSHTVLYELLWQIAFAYTHELRPYLQLLLAMLTLEDSWQQIRIHKALKGIPDDHSSRDGLFETIQRSKNHYQKRAYQCIKMLVTLFSTCQVAKNILMSNGDLKKKWSWSVEWLHEELERGMGGRGGGGGPQYQGGNPAPHLQYYSNWSPPAGSNETAHGYFLERSHSARITLEKAFELLPEDDEEADEQPAASMSAGGAVRAVSGRGEGRVEEEGPGGETSKKGGDGGGGGGHYDENY